MTDKRLHPSPYRPIWRELYNGARLCATVQGWRATRSSLLLPNALMRQGRFGLETRPLRYQVIGSSGGATYRSSVVIIYYQCVPAHFFRWHQPQQPSFRFPRAQVYKCQVAFLQHPQLAKWQSSPGKLSFAYLSYSLVAIAICMPLVLLYYQKRWKVKWVFIWKFKYNIRCPFYSSMLVPLHVNFFHVE